MKTTPLLLLLAILTLPAFGQLSPVGYYNGSKREIARELYLLPNAQVLFFQSYGAADQTHIGTWQQKGDTVLLSFEKKDQPEGFHVYARRDEAIEKGKRFTFNRLPDNTAFSFSDSFETATFKRIRLPYKYYQRRKEELQVISKPVHSFFLALPNKEQQTHLVAQFKGVDSLNDVHVFYSPAIPGFSYTVKGVVKNNELQLLDESNQAQSFGGRQPLPADYEKQVRAAIQQANPWPEALSRYGEAPLLKMSSVQAWSTALQVIEKEVYITHQEAPQQEGVTDATTPATVPDLKPVKKTAPKKTKPAPKR